MTVIIALYFSVGLALGIINTFYGLFKSNKTRLIRRCWEKSNLPGCKRGDWKRNMVICFLWSLLLGTPALMIRMIEIAQRRGHL